MNNYLMQQAKVGSRLHGTEELTCRRGRALPDGKRSALYVDAAAHSERILRLTGASLSHVPVAEFVNLSVPPGVAWKYAPGHLPETPTRLSPIHRQHRIRVVCT